MELSGLLGNPTLSRTGKVSAENDACSFSGRIGYGTVMTPVILSLGDIEIL